MTGADWAEPLVVGSNPTHYASQSGYRDKAINSRSIHTQVVRFPGTITPRQAVELLTNGCCGD